MPAPRIHLLLFSVLASLVFTACGTTQDHRIRVYPRDFNALDESSQRKIRDGQIERGFSSRMVYMALGDPKTLERRETDEGEFVTWTYRGYLLNQGGEEEQFQTTNDLIWGSPFARQAYDRLRIVFLHDEVISIQAIPRHRLRQNAGGEGTAQSREE